MYRYLRAGVHAAVLQTALVTSVALAAILKAGADGLLLNPDPSSANGAPLGYHTALASSDVLLAIWISLLRIPAVLETARNFHSGFCRLSPLHPGRAAASLIAQLLLASVGFAAVALRPPPAWFLSIASEICGAGSGFVAWPAIMSIGTAAFGASSHAAILGDPS